jgi:hypothetical protein
MGTVTYILACLLFFGGLAILGLWIKIYVKSTVEKSIELQFDLKLEKFKQDFTRDLHSLDRKDKYQLAALDKRLEAHQLAYTIVNEMPIYLYVQAEKKKEFNTKLIDFWDRYSLYLTNDARKVFREAWSSYGMQDILLKRWKELQDDKTANLLSRQFDSLTKAPELIAKAIDLEAMAVEPVTADGRTITPFGIEEKKED